LLIICKSHITEFEEIKVGDLAEVMFLVSWAIGEYKISGGALALRFGSTEFTGATVSHLHLHLIQPDVDKNGQIKVVHYPIG
jgi:ATP adenylyltransferase